MKNLRVVAKILIFFSLMFQEFFKCDSNRNFLQTSNSVNISNRANRFLAVARIEPEMCTGDSEIGVCKTTYSCKQLNGTILGGTCGTYNLGTCCLPIFTPTVNKTPVTVREKVSLIVGNKNFDSNSFKFPKMTGSCQIRLDFKRDLAAPSGGICLQDSFRVTGSVTVKSLTLCGSISQPLYLSYGSSESINLDFYSKSKKQFEVKVQHIDCNSAEKVDDHCLLSHSAPSGEVESFGWNVEMSSQITGLEYNICVGEKSEHKPLTWEMCSPIDLSDPEAEGNTNSFYTTHNFGNYLGKDQSCVGKTSYVSIPGVGTFCGGHFAKIDNAPSNMIMVKTVSEEINRYTSDTYYPLEIIEGLDMDAAKTCETVEDSNYIIFEACKTVGDFTTKCFCTGKKETPSGKYARPNILGFCLRYTQT